LATEKVDIQEFSMNGHSEPLHVFKNSFTDQHNEVEQIISSKPPFFVRWGTVFFFLFLVLIAAVAWFIQYPDLITASAKLNSIHAPKEVVTRTNGKLQLLTVKNGEIVKAGAVLGFMESIAKPDAIFQVKSQTDSIAALISNNSVNKIVDYFPNYNHQLFLNELGEMQQPFQVFMQSFISFRDYISNGFYLRKRAMLQTDMVNIQRLHNILYEQKRLLLADVKISNETFEANESLVKEKVISPLDYRNEKSKLIARQLSLPQVNSSIVSNEAQQNEKHKEIAELENQILIQKSNFIQALQTFSSKIKEWEYKYVLRAPVSGAVSFAGFIQENQEITTGQLLLYVEPENTNYFAEIFIPQYNFGKVKIGQDVLLKFNAYPHEQFGTVTGKIQFVSNVSTDSGFLAKIQLPHGLLTNYKKELSYRNGLVAKAEIVTENLRLLQRFYYNIVRQVKR
jgi:multidrug efflux pump subunit AcrA (membrane-fusion protein)